MMSYYQYLFFGNYIFIYHYLIIKFIILFLKISKKCEGQLNIMCETCSNTHICRVDNLEKSYCSNSPFQW